MAIVKDETHHFVYNACQIEEPNTMEVALSGNFTKEWKAAANAKYESLLENETWELVEPPPGRSAMGSKWVFRI